jgi:DNA-binding NarL/FixJ family response regulator
MEISPMNVSASNVELAGAMPSSDPDRRVLIVEDHPLVAAATADLLQKQHPTLQQVIVDCTRAAIEQAATGHWWRIFVDLSVPGACGLSLVRTFEKLGLAQKCCVITATRDERVVAEAKRMGVLGYIEKSCTVAAFCRAIDDIVRGVPVFPAASAGSEPRLAQLTSRQLAILRLLYKGLSSKQVAHELQIAEGTVKNHTFALLRALGASNRAHAVARGLELGLLESIACESG